jgi:hypothetical protein
MVRLLLPSPHTLLLSFQQVVSLISLPVNRLSNLLTGKVGGEGGGGAKSQDGENAWLFINHSILNTSEYNILYV